MVSNDRTLEKRALLNFISMRREKGWIGQFLLDGFKIQARIMDHALAEAHRFDTGDSIDATIEIRQRYIHSYQAYENVRFKIKEFHRHIPAQEPPSLFEEK